MSSKGFGPKLNSTKDWDGWYLQAMSTAYQHGVWDQVNPDLKTPPEPLVEPKMPIPGDARVRQPPSGLGQTNLTPSELVEEDLTSIEMEKLRNMRRLYFLERQEYKEKEKGLNNFRAHLLRTVPTIQITSALQQPTI